MLLTRNEATFVDSSISPFENALALAPVLHKSPHELSAISPCHLTLSVHFVTTPLACVSLAVGPAVITVAA